MESSEAGLPKTQVEAMTKREKDRYIQSNPVSQKLGQDARANWLKGVPHHWMLDWSTPFPLFVADAKGATLTDADGHTYDDFCLGDTGSMFGHSPEPVAKAIAAGANSGVFLVICLLAMIALPIVGAVLVRGVRPARRRCGRRTSRTRRSAARTTR